jgi:hypothetical protein
MEDIIGILHKDGKRSHYISLDEYFTKEMQSYFYDYFNSQEEEYNFMYPESTNDPWGSPSHLGVNLDKKGLQESEQVQYISEWLDFIRDSKLLKEVELFQVIKNVPVEQHRDGGESIYEHVSDGMISPDGDFFTTNLWRHYYWFWFRLSDDKKMFFGKNKDIEFKGRGMIYNGMDYHGCPEDMGDNTNQWSILMKGLPTEDLSKHFNLK